VAGNLRTLATKSIPEKYEQNNRSKFPTESQSSFSARNFKPDVIFLDVMMPKIDGGEVAAQIQADRELHDTPDNLSHGAGH
jgi:CheY-like chemotaxis protein